MRWPTVGRLSVGRLSVGRVALYIEPRDLWVGAYVAPTAVYLCPLPAVVCKWTRRTTPPASTAPTTPRSAA